MRHIVPLLLAAAALADAPKPPSSEDKQVADPLQAKFNPVTMAGVPAGVQASPIAVDPATKGSIAYAKIPMKTHFPMHWHSYTEYTALLSGTATLTLDGKPYDISPGSYFVIPAKTHHALDCGTAADCLLLTRRAGPTDYNWVK